MRSDRNGAAALIRFVFSATILPPRDQVQSTNERIRMLAASAGRIFADGSFIELTRDLGGTLKFLTLDGGTVKIVDQFAHGDATYTTPRVHDSIRDSLILPSDLKEFGSTRQLINKIANSFSHAGAGSIAVPLSFLVCASWLLDYLPTAPYLWVVVPATFTTAALKETLRLLCRHAFVVNPISNWPTSLPMVLQPTLIAEVNRPSRRLLESLRASQNHCVSPTRTGGVVDQFCAKVIFSREPLEDREAAGFPLEIFLASGEEYVSPMEAGHAARVAEEFQNKLLCYRVAKVSKVAPPSFDLGWASAPIRALAHSLAGAIVGDDHVQVRIVPYLREFDADLQTDGPAKLRRTIIEALVTHWSQQEVGVTDLTGDINTLIVGGGGSGELSPETVGWKLKALGLRTTTVALGLKGLEMDSARPLIAKIAAIYGIKVPEDRSRAATKRTPVPGDDEFVRF